jgi:uncharacterized membrane protein
VIPKTINGLPLHPLIIHLTVVLLPLAALAVLAAGVWPRARQWLKASPLVLSVLAVIVLGLTYATGKNLKAEIGTNPLIARHEHLAHQLLVPVLGLVVAAILIEIVRRQQGTGTREPARADSGSTVLVVIAAVLAVVFAAGTTVQTVRVGEAGAKAVWHGVAAH